MKVHRRLGTRSRCIRCRMRVDLCLCAELVELTAKTRFVLVMHSKEANKPTNTGFLVRTLLPATEIRMRGRRERVELGDLADAGVLFPREDAEELTRENAPPALIVPDGTWRQARNIVRRDLKLHRCFRLPAGAPGEFHLRTTLDPSAVSTFEAIARVVGIVGDHETAERMMRVFRIMVDRTMWIRGKTATEDVLGGVPELALRLRGNNPESGRQESRNLGSLGNLGTRIGDYTEYESGVRFALCLDRESRIANPEDDYIEYEYESAAALPAVFRLRESA